MDPNAQSVLESFVRSMQLVSDEIKRQNPDCVIAPMFGAVPFIDMLAIIDDEFPHHKVEYVPASNKVYRLREVLRGAFASLISDHSPHGGSFLSLDEVVSGNSLVRVQKQFMAARMDYANKKTVDTFGPSTDFTQENVRKFRDDAAVGIRYHTVGIVDGKMERQNKVRVPEYEELVRDGTVIPIPTPCIVSMDRADFFPARYRTVVKDGETLYLPIVDNFTVSGNYLKFLRNVAAICGKDPSRVTVQNMAKIQESYKHVPEHLRTP